MIRMAYLGTEGFYNEEPWDVKSLHKVSYNIGFTFGGPVAYNVHAQQQSMIRKVRQFQADSSPPS